MRLVLTIKRREGSSGRIRGGGGSRGKVINFLLKGFDFCCDLTVHRAADF